jgi:hypothetical protein
MAQDVLKILKDLELKAVGLTPEGDKMQEGYFASFRSIGLPITKEDYENPFEPTGGNLDQPIPRAAATDPTNAPKTGSSNVSDSTVAAVSKSQQSYLNTFLLTDSKLQMSNNWSVMPGSSRVSDTWYAIITGANGIPLVQGLSPALQQAYDNAKSKLQNADRSTTPEFKDYQDYRDKYTAKEKAYNKAYADSFTDPVKRNNWPLDGVVYDDDKKQAMQDWVNSGSKEDIEEALNILSARGSDPSMALINQSKDRFTNSLLEFTGIGKIPYTVLLPNTWYDKDNDDGWNEYSTTDFHSESHYSASQTAYGGGGGFSVGLWSVGGGFNSDSQQTNLNVQTNNLEISFDYCTVDIIRPWLDTTLLNLKGWFLMGDYKKNCISDGTMAQQLTTDKVEPLFLPSLVTSLILVKNVSIKWDNWQADWASASSSVSGSTSIGFGPFSVSGHYSHSQQSRDFTCDASGESLVIPGIQLLGYISAINPGSPSVDSSQYVTSGNS